MIENSIGKHLRELRSAKGISLDRAAVSLGISKSALSMYECDARIPRDGVKVRIARFYGNSVESIFFANIEH